MPRLPRPAPTSSEDCSEAASDVRRPLRADAERNRRLILDTASAVFAERGLVAGFDEIARAAGVGVGTVYRRFPDREDLIDALFADRVEAMVGLATDAAQIEDPWAALAWFLERSVAEQASDRGLAEVMGSGLRGRRRLENARSQMLPAVGLLIQRADAAGVLRDGVVVLDLAIIGRVLSSISTEANPDLWRRYVPIAMDGLRRAPDSSPLPSMLPEESDLAQLVQWRRPSGPSRTDPAPAVTAGEDR